MMDAIPMKCTNRGTVNITPVNECVLFARETYDSHAAFDEKTLIYTFRMAGKYLIRDKQGLRVLNVSAGDIITDPEIVIGEHCSVFFRPRGDR